MSSTDTRLKHLDNRIAWLKEMSIRLDQADKDGKYILSTKSASDICTHVATMMEDLEKRVSRLETEAYLRS